MVSGDRGSLTNGQGAGCLAPQWLYPDNAYGRCVCLKIESMHSLRFRSECGIEVSLSSRTHLNFQFVAFRRLCCLYGARIRDIIVNLSSKYLRHESIALFHGGPALAEIVVAVNQERHLVDRQTYKLIRSAALAEW